MRSSLEPLEGNKVKLSVNIDEDEFDRDIDQAFRKIAREVRLPGFRAGKAPRRVLEARIGLAPAREQALRDSIPTYLARAVREHDVDLIATPEVEITGGTESGAVDFDATCEVRPEVTVPGYGGLRVELANPEPTDKEVEDALSEQLRRHGSLTDIERPVARGDYVTLDLVTTRDGEEVPALNTEDWSYEVGQGWIADELDEQLIGAAAGDTLTFSATPKGTEEPADFQISVTKAQELVLPEPTDEWVEENLAEFDSVDAWRAATRERLQAMKLNDVRQQLVGKVTEALTGLTDIEAPESLVQSDLRRRVEATVRQLQSQGISVEQWMAVTGQDEASFITAMKGASEQAVKVDLALRAVAAAESIEADEGDLAAEYDGLAMQSGQKANQIRKAYERNDLVPELAAQVRKQKALDWLLHHVELVDPAGNALDRELILGHSHDDETDEADETTEPSDTAEPSDTEDTETVLT